MVVPNSNETEIHRQLAGRSPAEIVIALAEAKVRAAEARLDAEATAGAAGGDEDLVIVGCDSMLEFEGRLMGKPSSPEQAFADFSSFSGKTACVHTGQHVAVRLVGGIRRQTSALSDTVIHFADLGEVEIRAYVATGEPLRVAGCTIDGIGGAFVRSVEGDPHGVGGLSLPLLRQMVVDLGLEWSDLWNEHSWIAREAQNDG